jgi:hypothetical protein
LQVFWPFSSGGQTAVPIGTTHTARRCLPPDRRNPFLGPADAQYAAELNTVDGWRRDVDRWRHDVGGWRLSTAPDSSHWGIASLCPSHPNDLPRSRDGANGVQVGVCVLQRWWRRPLASFSRRVQKRSMGV